MTAVAATARAAAAETLTAGPNALQLLLDASATEGAVSVHRVRLTDGADGASPHRHDRSSEVFYLIDGTADLLTGTCLITATRGDLVVVPPGLPHAFAAAPGCDAELLVLITPGVERFDFFRDLVRVLTGTVDPAHFLDDQARYDTYAAHSPPWSWLRNETHPTLPT